MTQEERTKLRAGLKALQGLRDVFQKYPGPNAEGSAVPLVKQVTEKLAKDFPGLLPSFEPQDFFSHQPEGIGVPYYRVGGVSGYLEVAIGAVEAALEEDEEKGVPVIEHREFKFVTDGTLRKLIERDYVEIQRAYVSQCWKSVIILSGGLIEALLLDQLKARQANALAAKSAPKEPNLDKWDLFNLIKVAVELQIVGPGAEKFSNGVRDYRNLVHPGVEIRTGLTISPELARIALEVVNLIHSELS